MDIELPSQARQGGNIAILTALITFKTENSAGATAAPQFTQPSAAWS